MYSSHPTSGPVIRRAQTGLLARWTSVHTAWLLFGPPALMVGTRWILQLFTDREGGTPALLLAPVSTTSGTLDLLWPVAAVLAVLAGAVLLLRRMGSRRALVVLGAAWVLLGLGASAAMLHRHLNENGLLLHDGIGARAAPVMAKVMTREVKLPNLHSLGGTELVLLVHGLRVPHRLLIDDPRATALQPGSTLALQLVPGRFSGLFVTGWQAQPAAAPAVPAASAAPAAPVPAPTASGAAVPGLPASH